MGSVASTGGFNKVTTSRKAYPSGVPDYWDKTAYDVWYVTHRSASLDAFIATSRKAYPSGVPGSAKFGRAPLRMGLGERHGMVGGALRIAAAGKIGRGPGRFCSAMPRCW